MISKSIKIQASAIRIRPEKSEVMRLLSDTSVAHELFGWTPQFVLEDGLRETIEWYRDHLSRFKVGSYPL
jgi:dTDP-glucose 4,6-dehydratase